MIPTMPMAFNESNFNNAITHNNVNIPSNVLINTENDNINDASNTKYENAEGKDNQNH